MSFINNNGQCPILMSDGRAFTDYRPRSDINKSLMQQLNVSDPYNYRINLQSNADSVISSNYTASEYRNKCECSDMSNVEFSSCKK